VRSGDLIVPNVDSGEEKIRWVFVAAYVADVAGLLDKDKRLKFTHLAEQYAGDETWQGVVEHDLEINKKFIASLFKACRKHMSAGHSLCFILRGLGCPYSEARVRDIIGDNVDE
jgi:hypothetical protein